MDENPILEHFNAPYHRGPLLTATHSGYFRNAACGDEVTLYAEIRGAKIVASGFVAAGCMVCQAAASILCEQIDGQDISSLKDLTPEKMLLLIGVPLTPRRQQCGLLPLYALRKAVSFDPADESEFA